MRIKAKATFAPRAETGRFIEASVKPAIRASVVAAGALVVQEAKRIVPVRTGALRDSIHSTVRDSAQTVIADIEASMHYAGYVEYGTGRRGAASAGRGPYPYDPNWPGQVAQPYMRPALDTAREAIRGVFRSQIALALRT